MKGFMKKGLTAWFIIAMIVMVAILVAGFFIFKNLVYETSLKKTITKMVDSAQASAWLVWEVKLKEVDSMDMEDLSVDDREFAIRFDIENGEVDGLRFPYDDFLTGGKVCGIFILPMELVEKVDPNVAEKARIEIKQTEMAYTQMSGYLDRAMVMGCVKGDKEKAEFFGVVLNNNPSIPDYITEKVFGKKIYEGKSVGNATIFLDGVRITTSVLKHGKRAVGTLLSKKVYDVVIKKGQPYRGEAFVVVDWYLTAYDPIKDVRGDIVGILYTGYLKKYAMMDALKVSTLMGYFSGLMIVIFLASLLLMRYVFSKLMKRVEEFMHRIGDGDLTADVKIDTEDEIGSLVRTLTRMRDDLKKIVADIKKAQEDTFDKANSIAEIADDVGRLIEEISKSLDRVVDAISNVSASVEETSSGVDEVASGSDVVAKSTEDLERQSSELKSSVEDGENALKDIVSRIDRVALESQETVSGVERLSKSMENIESIVETINSIAEQTNLLALNAAIESARAGEAGKGFAVVAEEIRKLAEESRRSTEQIADILSSIREEAMKVGDMTVKLVKMIEEMRESSDIIYDVFGRIKSNAEVLDRMTNDLAAVVQEQNAAIQEISTAMDSAEESLGEILEEMKSIQSKMKVLESDKGELIKTSDELEKVVDVLRKVVGRFKI